MCMDFEAVITYLVGLGQRHNAVKSAASGITDSAVTGRDAYPRVFVEEDPLADELTEGADEYRFAFHVLDKPKRQGGPSLNLLSWMKVLADQLIYQMRVEGVLRIQGKPSYLSLVGDANDDLATGWRVEIVLVAEKELNRRTNADFFTPYVPTA